MSTLAALFADLELLVQKMEDITFGDDSTSVTHKGRTRSSIASEIKNQFSAIQSMVAGRQAFKTKLLMDAAGAPAADVNGNLLLSEVWADVDQLSNGLYGWNGTAWEKSSIDSSVALLKVVEGMIVDSEKSNARQFGKEISTAGLYNNLDNSSLVPVICDAEGNVALGFDRNTGKAFLDVSLESSRIISRKSGMMTSSSIGDLDAEFAVCDSVGRVAFYLDSDGKAVFPGGLSKEKSVAALQGATDFYDINHVLFYGQSLSVGANGQPVISDSQRYGNITFTGGPRSASDEVVGFKLLVEDTDPAPDGGTNRGETCCSAATDYVSQSIQAENGFASVDMHKMLASTAGKGGTTIAGLSKSQSWYQLLVDHIQGGFDVSQSLNQSYGLSAICWLQGETDIDSGSTVASYKAALIQLKDDINADAKSITSNVKDVPFISYQTSWKAAQNKNIYLAQYQAAKENSDIYICAPTYHLQYSSDNLHLSAAGYKALGHYFGKAYRKVVCDGESWSPVSPKKITRQGSVIDVVFHVPDLPLSFDTAKIPFVENYGFYVLVDGVEVSISSVAISAVDRVRLVLSSPAQGVVSVGYGKPGPSGLVDYGLFGNLRDGCAEKIDGFDMQNWCVLFEEIV